MRITKVKAGAVPAIPANDIDITDDVEDTLRDAVKYDHEDQHGNQCERSDCDICAMLRHGYVLAAASCLVNSTEPPHVGEALRALRFNGKVIDLRAAWETWLSYEIVLHECPACEARLYDVNPKEYSCGCCGYEQRDIECNYDDHIVGSIGRLGYRGPWVARSVHRPDHEERFTSEDAARAWLDTQHLLVTNCGRLDVEEPAEDEPTALAGAVEPPGLMT